MALAANFIDKVTKENHLPHPTTGIYYIAGMKAVFGEYANQGGATGGSVETGLGQVRYFQVQPLAGAVSGTPDIFSTATAGGGTTLTDTTQNNTVDAFAGYQIYIVSGTGVGQFRTIASNTSNAYTVSAAWTTNPDNTSVYLVGPAQNATNYAFVTQTMPSIAVNGAVTIVTAADSIGYWMAMGI